MRASPKLLVLVNDVGGLLRGQRNSLLSSRRARSLGGTTGSRDRQRVGCYGSCGWGWARPNLLDQDRTGGLFEAYDECPLTETPIGVIHKYLQD